MFVSETMMVVCVVMAARWYGLSVLRLQVLRDQWRKALDVAAYNYHECHAIDAGKDNWDPVKRENQVSYYAGQYQSAWTWVETARDAYLDALPWWRKPDVIATEMRAHEKSRGLPEKRD